MNVFIIEYDNGRQYDEADRQAVLVTRSQRRAESLVKELNGWLDRMQAKYPPISFDLDDDKWYELDQKRTKRLSRLPCPYGLMFLRAEIKCNAVSPRFNSYALPVVK